MSNYTTGASSVIVNDFDRQPTIRRDGAGMLRIEWAHPVARPVVHVAPEVLESIVQQLNELQLRRMADDRVDDA